jgi:hypothetical protein
MRIQVRSNGYHALMKMALMTTATGSMVLALLAAVSLVSSAGAMPVERELTRDQARTVVRIFLKSSGQKTDSVEFALEDQADAPELPGFILFDAYYNSADRLVNIGEYAVDRKSAALWERVACERLNSDELLRYQEQLRLQGGLSEPNEVGSVSPCS